MKDTTSKAGWRISPWLGDTGIGRSTYYALPPELKPKKVYVGTTPIIVESPAEYLQRMAELQAGSKAA